MDAANLELADRLAVQRLKYVRQRSMRNPKWRDADYLTKFVQRRYLRWAPDTPLEHQRLGVERALKDYKEAAAGSDLLLRDDRWMAVRASVDTLIATRNASLATASSRERSEITPNTPPRMPLGCP